MTEGWDKQKGPQMLITTFIFTALFSFAEEKKVESQTATPPQTPQEEEFTPDAISYSKPLKNRYSLFLHKRNYLMPIAYNRKTHNELYSDLVSALGPLAPTEPFYQDIEAEMQISFFVPLLADVFNTGWDFLFAYTFHSYWQVYNSAWSKPFRENNYNPELFVRRNLKSSWLKKSFMVSVMDVGFMHESNGQIQLLSRSWDRVFARMHMLNEHLSAIVTIWYRIPDNPEKDDNSNIYRYYGYGELTLQKSLGAHTIDLKVPFSERPGLEINYSYPWKDYGRFFVNLRQGYAHSLIEYDKEIQRIGVGITLESYSDKRNIKTIEKSAEL